MKSPLSVVNIYFSMYGSKIRNSPNVQRCIKVTDFDTAIIDEFMIVA